MAILFIDEDPNCHGDFALGVLIVHNKEWLQVFRGKLHTGYGPPTLFFHATDDKQSDKAKCQMLRDDIAATLLPVVRAKENAEWKLFKGKNEKQVWAKLMQWISTELKPSTDRPVNILHDRCDFAKDTRAMFSGYSKAVYIMRPMDKIKSSETTPDQNKYMIGVVDYMLHFRIYKELERPRRKR